MYHIVVNVCHVEVGSHSETFVCLFVGVFIVVLNSRKHEAGSRSQNGCAPIARVPQIVPGQ
jgi:hypothetical protein